MCKSNIQKNKKVDTFAGFEEVNKSEFENINEHQPWRQIYTERAEHGKTAEKVGDLPWVQERLKNVFKEDTANNKIDGLLKLQRPPEPKFELRTFEEIRAMGRFEKKNYNKRMKAFEKEREKWDKTEAGLAWNTKVKEIMSDIKTEQAKKKKKAEQAETEQANKKIEQVKTETEQVKTETEQAKKKTAQVKTETVQANKKTEQTKKKNEQTKKETYSEKRKKAVEELTTNIEQLTTKYGYEEIEADPDAMDAMLEKETTDEEFIKQETEISTLEAERAEKKAGVGGFGLNRYMHDTAYCRDMNKYLRSEDKDKTGSEMNPNIIKWAEEGTKLLSSSHLSRDLVSKRAVKGVTAVAHMLGLDNPENLTNDQIQNALLDRMYSDGPVIMTEKGFCSTSVSTKSGYGASSGKSLSLKRDEHDIGVEFIILCKKGTKGLNFSRNGGNGVERELMLCPGTKFEVVNAYFNDGTPDHDERKICEGNKKSWKIYLKTVVDDEEKQNA